MDGQAESAPESVDDLAQYLVENPEADAKEPKPTDNEPERKPDNSEAETEDDSPDDDPVDDPGRDDDDSEKAEGQKSGLKFKVPIKGDDGADTTIEVDEKELVAGYQRHADYTRKTQELSREREEAYTVVSQKLEEGRNYYMQEAQKAHLAIRTLAGLKSDAEMAALAHSNPGEWATEVERVRTINSVLAQIDHGMRNEHQAGSQQALQEELREHQSAWGVLGQKGIDKLKLRAIFEGAIKHFEIPRERFAKVTDPKLVLMMRDAVAYRELKDKAATVSKKVQNAPKLPPARQGVPPREQANKRLSQRFKTGKADVDDLASFIQANKL